jgi:hypothetical protein
VEYHTSKIPITSTGSVILPGAIVQQMESRKCTLKCSTPAPTAPPAESPRRSAPRPPDDKSMLDGTFCWAAGSNTLPQYMQIDLGSSFRVHGVVTQGRFDGDQCVLEMEVQYSLTTSGFVSATALDGTTRFFLPTSWSRTAKTLSNFSQPVTARYIRIYPQRWYNAMSMRAGVLTSLPGAAWNACADCPLNSLSGAGSTAPSSCRCNAGTRVGV